MDHESGSTSTFKPEWAKTTDKANPETANDEGISMLLLNTSMLPDKTMKDILNQLPRRVLRTVAKRNGVKIGKDKIDTIKNLTEARIPIEVGFPCLPLWER